MWAPVHLDELATLQPHGGVIGDDAEKQAFWIQQPHMLSYDTHDANLITSIRIRGEHLHKVSANKDPSTLSKLRSTGLDPDDNRLYVSPTNHRAGRLTYSLCMKQYARTAAQRGKIRVAVVYDNYDGIDLGVYTAVAFSSGCNNFLILEPDFAANPQDIQRPASIGTGVVVDGVAYRSRHEGQFAVLLARLGIPFDTERSNPTVATNDGGKYVVDFKIYPEDPERVAFVELKPFFPTREEVDKAVTLHRKTSVDVFVVWGEMCQGLGVHADKFGVDGKIRPDHSYDRGLRAMKVHTDEHGYVKKDEGYYFMANNAAKGMEWREVEEAEADGARPVQVNPTVFHAARLAEVLDQGARVLTRERMRSLRLVGRVQKSTRIRSTATGKVYRAVDGLKAHLYKDEVLDARADPEMPDPSDWNSLEVREAFRAARSAVF